MSFYSGFSSGSFYSTASGKPLWYNDAELSVFSTKEDSGVSCSNGITPKANCAEAVAASSQNGHQNQKEPSSTVLEKVRVAANPNVRSTSQAEPSAAGHPSFYGKSQTSGHFFRGSRPPRTETDRPKEEHRAPPPETDENAPVLPGNSLSVVPKRAPRDAASRALDKEIASSKTPADAFSIAMRAGHSMDAANWANLIYAMAHFQKHSVESEYDVDGRAAPLLISKDPRWSQCCGEAQKHLNDMTARDTANVLWALATLGLKKEPLFMEAADAMRGKIAVCDPISVSKAAWALTAVPSRDKRHELFNHLAVPVVLRAEVFPIGALTMTCYAFAKADHRDANVYDGLSAAIQRYEKADLRPIDVCNVVWAFCTVGYRDDKLFTKICEDHLTDAAALKGYNPQDLTNTAWGFSKVIFRHESAMNALAKEGASQYMKFKPIHFTNFFYSFATMRMKGPDGFLHGLADAAVKRVGEFESANISIIIWSLAMLKQSHVLIDEGLRVILQPHVCRTITSRTLSMLFLAFFRFGRIMNADTVFDAARACGLSVGASGWSAVMMTGEQGPDASRETRLQVAMANEANDDRMRACITNAAAIRLMKRGLHSEAKRLLSETRADHPRSWSVVSARLFAQVATYEENLAMSHLDTKEVWEKPVQSGIHPIAATRQNEGPHAYTREMMTLQAVLCGAPSDDVDASMAAIEQFAESRSLWLKITAWEKAIVVHEVAKLNRPPVVVEIGAYVGYSAMNLARAVRPHGGRVASIEVDPIHATIVRNMVEYAGLTDSVDVWTGYCFDVIPHMLEKYGPRSVGMVFMDQKGTRFHTDLNLMEELDLLADGAVILADNVLKPGAPLYIWELAAGPFTNLTAVSVREFLLQSEDWMVLGFHDVRRGKTPDPPHELHRVAFESDAFRKKSMFDSVAPNKAEWWAFSQRFNHGLQVSGCMPRIVGLHGRDNPVLQPADIAAIFERAGRLPT